MKTVSHIIFFVIILISISCGTSVISENKATVVVKEKENDSLILYCHKFDSLNSLVRDCKIEAVCAKTEFSNIISKIRSQCNKAVCKEYAKDKWIFPVQGYNYSNIGGTNGEGYIVGKYDYFAGNKHTGHPSQDIFIFDKDQNTLDDKTGKPVNVLSLTGGLVIAACNKWETTETRRGGIYLWIYDNTTDAIIYYAHNSKNYVSVGDTVFPGMKIGEVGRSGLNAFKKRSPTHLHLSYLNVSTGLPIPENIYKELKNGHSK